MKRMVFIVCCLIACKSYGFENTNCDTLKLANGTIAIGNISDITKDNIYFSPSDENVNYVYNKDEVLQAIFTNGRIESYTRFREPIVNTQKEIIKNSVAVLPFLFNNNGYLSTDNLPFEVQDAFLRKISETKSKYVYQDVIETNILLKRNGINLSSLRDYTTSELCNILGVEWIVTGDVYRTKTNSLVIEKNSQNSNTNSSSPHGSEQYTKTYDYASFDSTVSVKIYNYKGIKIFDQSWKSMRNTHDGYLYAAEYIAWKTQFFKGK